MCAAVVAVVVRGVLGGRVGKTELAKALAAFLFNAEDAMVRAEGVIEPCS